MTYKSVTEGKPKPLTRVWVETDTGRETTGYVKSNGEWYLLCRKVAAENPEVIRWEDDSVSHG
ncbi:gp12 [Enterobacter hormaechei]|uniref:hypothetical protein n=1 Tax=Enterobacter hormaechei TaxID=158836 RepID=UPI00079A018C|nr:hypothetical protein [Enterobacter hormaechei]CZW48595.1 gp12 [Enterobacter hormaechei]SAH67338.1 gp12 [Enterobacter hormaechei]